MKIDYSKYVPVHFYHLNLYEYYEHGGFERKGRDSGKMKKQLQEKFNSCIDDLKFSWDAYFSEDKAGFTEESIRYHFNSMYDQTFSKYGKNFAVFVKNVAHGNRLADALGTKKYNVINVCGKERESIGYINRMMDDEKNGKPTIMISCSRNLTGVTLTKMHGLIIMGTLTSAVNYIQFGLRGKNTYKGRQYPCSIFDLNTISFLKTDAFKENVIARAHYTDQTIEETLKNDFNQYCFEIFELNNGNNFDKKTNFDEEIHNNWVIDENGEISSVAIAEGMFDDDELLSSQDLVSELKLNENKLLITEKQCDKPEKEKKKIKKGNNNEKPEKVEDKHLLFLKIKRVVNFVPGFIYGYDKTSIDEIINDKSCHKSFAIFSGINKGIEVLKFVKNCWKNDPLRWQNLNNAIVTNSKRFAV